MLSIPIYKRFFSFFYPILIRRANGGNHQLLELYLYRNQLQLATFDAVYSDGDRYKPVKAAFKHIRQHLPDIRNVLVLGTGLGSTVRIMNKAGFYPTFTLVDIDAVVLQWATEFLDEKTRPFITTACADAKDYIEQCSDKFDLLIIDVFQGRHVPDFVMSEAYLQQCRQLVRSGGIVILNYIINDAERWGLAEASFNKVYPGNKILQLGVNRIFTAIV